MAMVPRRSSPRVSEVRSNCLRESHPASKLPASWMHLHLLGFLDETRHTDIETVLERGDLGDTAAGGIAAHARLRVRHLELDDLGDLRSDGSP